ncbi:MAG: serine hydrolase [Pseudomonadota bacterium]
MNTTITRLCALLAATLLGACGIFPENVKQRTMLVWDQGPAQQTGTRDWLRRKDLQIDAQPFFDAGRDALIVMRDGVITFEAFASEADGDYRRNVRSIAKPVVAAAISIAAQQDLVDPNAPISRIAGCGVPEHLRPLTIAELTHMVGGLRWKDEELSPYLALNTPCAILKGDAPETHQGAFRYSGTQTQLAGEVLSAAAKIPLADYVQAHLFDPIGIAFDWWQKKRFGTHWAGSHLVISPYDMLAIGQLFLEGGRYQGNQVIPTDHIDEVFFGGVATDEPGVTYAQGWWREMRDGKETLTASGRGGHAIVLVPAEGIVIVMSALLSDLTGDAIEPMARQAWAHLDKLIKEL